MTHSCLYVGQVRHRRHTPKPHAFRYRLYLLYLDLDEIPQLFQRLWLWSARHFNLVWFRRADYPGDRTESLADSIRTLVAEKTGMRPTGPIRLLTQLRHFGYGFNPLSLFYCYDATGKEVETIVAQVRNTPWSESIVYVLPIDPEHRGDRHVRLKNHKEMHVSPFMPMDLDYHWTLQLPGEHLGVHIETLREGQRVFDATLTLQKKEWSLRNRLFALVRYPAISFQVILGIHYEALRLWRKGIPYHPHPSSTN